MFRILASIALLFSALFMPFWVSVALMLAGIIYFAVFGEAVMLFFLSDLLYGVKEAKFYNEIFISFVMATIILILVEIVKKKLKFYPNL